jgi:superfamily II DNA or RNA helicase/HKD family nuclease
MNEVRLVTSQVIETIIEEIEKATSICMLTSFAMRSGVSLLIPHLQKAAKRGADIKLLAGDYLFVTQPEALSLLADLQETVEARLWRSEGVSFHPKAYLFERCDESASVIVGSSNLSRSALTNGVEWNVVIHSGSDSPVLEDAFHSFFSLFYHNNTLPINRESVLMYEQQYNEYHRKHQNLIQVWTRKEELDLMFMPAGTEETLYVSEQTAEYICGFPLTPRAAQAEALEELNNTRQEGYNRAMVVMATGLGKTYLAGFFAANFQRVLFIAHREEILHQALHSWKNVLPERSHGLYDGKEKNTSADCIYASIYTLARERHLQKFTPDAFDLIVVDEFHHAAAASYRRVMDYFKPEFLLGITATPDRLDGKDVFALCDGNVAYRIDFIEAIQRGWLVPFRYYGVYDETDYSAIRWLGNRYDEEQLLAAQLREEIASKIYSAFLQHRQSRALGFCSSIAQANFLAQYFSKQGVRAVSLHSRSGECSRAEAIQMIEAGELDIIFTVDLFNEGVDIPSLDTLLFVRPTESLVIFTQQIGRGLRLHQGKEHCVIIDFIGNYRNADIKLQLFGIEEAGRKKEKARIQVPSSCSIELDLQVIHLLNELAKKRQPRKEKLRQIFLETKQELGRRPSYLEVHLHSGGFGGEYRQEFGSYFEFLYRFNELTEEEENIFERHKEWLYEVEKTVMNKSYKMVLLLAMLQRGPLKWEKPITPQEVAPFFHQYLTTEKYRYQTEARDKQTKQLLAQYEEEKIARLLLDMPMKKWSGSSKEFAFMEQDKFFFTLELMPHEKETIFEWTRQICEFRLHHYFERRQRNT